MIDFSLGGGSGLVSFSWYVLKSTGGGVGCGLGGGGRSRGFWRSPFYHILWWILQLSGSRYRSRSRNQVIHN